MAHIGRNEKHIPIMQTTLHVITIIIHYSALMDVKFGRQKTPTCLKFGRSHCLPNKRIGLILFYSPNERGDKHGYKFFFLVL